MTFKQGRLRIVLALSGAMILGLGLATFLADVTSFVPFELGPGVGTDEGGLTNILGDGNTGNGPDWADIFNGNGDKINPSDTAAFIKDDISAGSLLDNTVFSGGPGDKNQDHISDWTWTTSSVPAKDDVTNAYAYSKVSGGHMILYVGIEREDPSGDAHLDVEFYQNTIGLSAGPPCPGGGQCTFTFTGGGNKDGDLLASLDFSQGGTFGGLEVRRRHEGVKNNYDPPVQLGGQGCNAAGTVCAFTNGGDINGGPWPNYDNHGAVITTLSANAFTEFGIDVTALFNTTPCFSTFMVKSRSSQSFTATLKDFNFHGFASCNATASTAIHLGDSVGPNHTADDIQNTTIPALSKIHDKITVNGTPGFAAPGGTVTFKRYTTADCTGSSTDQTDVPLAPIDQANAVSAAESATFETTAGPLSYKAVYGGDSNYPNGATSACEPLTVSRFNSAVTTDLKLNNPAGPSVLNSAVDVSAGAQIVYDVAIITGNPTGPDPTGTVTFRRFTSGTCSGSFVDEPNVTIVADNNPNDGVATAISAAHTLSTGTGTFLAFQVIYNGNTVYNPSAASKCEPLCAFPFVP
jgi:hypothetical protein